MEIKHIIVQAGGKGTRMQSLTHNKPKALVPVDGLPMLFHLFRLFPNKKFIIIGDYKYDVLEKYLETFAEVDYCLVNGMGFQGTCAGLQAALRCIPADAPFLLIWSDLVLSSSFRFPEKDGNYIGISKTFPCRWKFEDGIFSEEPSTVSGVAGFFLFQDKKILADIPQEGEFVRWLKDQTFPKKAFPLEHTCEYGLLAEYQKQVKPYRCRPFNRIRMDGDVVTKEAVDEQGEQLAVRERAWYCYVMTQNFPQIPKIYSLQPLRMERIDGKNIYTYTDLSFSEKQNILNQIIDCLHKIQSLGDIPADAESYKTAYVDKTFDRLEKVRALIPFAQNKKIVINGKSCRNIFFHRAEVEQLTQLYIPTRFRLIHGDCTFSNTLLRKDGTPVLIDPRGYFGKTELYGDPAYDWAKLYYSIVGNYDSFNLKRFALDIQRQTVELQIASNHWEDMEETFFSLLDGEVVPAQIKLFHALIWLSLTTYTWEDYDSICAAFYNGLWYLEDVLSKE